VTESAPGERERLSSVYAGYEAERWVLDNPGNRAILDERISIFRELLPLTLAQTGDRLDIGCGGGTLLGVETTGAHLGVDLLFERLDPTSRAPIPICADGTRLPFRDASFDLVCLFTVLSSVLDHRLRARIAGEADRVLRPGGCVAWYDFRYPNPANRAVSPVREAELRRLFPGYAAEVRHVTVIPQLARRLGGRTTTLYPRLARLRPLTSHLAAVLVKPG
jgi:SAM-dependent methyltransferase